MKKKASKFWDTLFESLAETEGQSREEIVAELEEDGIDVEGCITEVKSLVKEKVYSK